MSEKVKPEECPRCGDEKLCRICRHFEPSNRKSGWGSCKTRHQVTATLLGPQSAQMTTSKNKTCWKFACECGHKGADE